MSSWIENILFHPYVRILFLSGAGFPLMSPWLANILRTLQSMALHYIRQIPLGIYYFYSRPYKETQHVILNFKFNFVPCPHEPAEVMKNFINCDEIEQSYQIFCSALDLASIIHFYDC
jgi:hypothetical protein